MSEWGADGGGGGGGVGGGLSVVGGLGGPDRLEGRRGRREMEGLDETFQCVSSSLTFCRA